MMGNLISPIWFYWIDVLDNLNNSVDLFLFISLIVTFGFFLASVFNNGYIIKYKSIAIWLMIIVLFFLLLYLFLPSKETVLCILITDYAASGETVWTPDAIKAAVDYIVQSMAQLG